jgi:hypothetical protein
MGKVGMRYLNWKLRFFGNLSSELPFQKGIQIHFSQKNLRSWISSQEGVDLLYTGFVEI